MPRATISYNNNNNNTDSKAHKEKIKSKSMKTHLFISTTIEGSRKSSTPKLFMLYLVLFSKTQKKKKNPKIHQNAQKSIAIL